jgi:hypothetical protein
VYDNPTGETIAGGGMGALGGMMLADRGQEWPAIDPRHEEYQKDVRVTMRHEGAHGRQQPAAAGHEGTAHEHH